MYANENCIPPGHGSLSVSCFAGTSPCLFRVFRGSRFNAIPSQVLDLIFLTLFFAETTLSSRAQTRSVYKKTHSDPLSRHQCTTAAGTLSRPTLTESLSPLLCYYYRRKSLQRPTLTSSLQTFCAFLTCSSCATLCPFCGCSLLRRVTIASRSFCRRTPHLLII